MCVCVCVFLYPQLSSMQSACAILSYVACLAVQYFSTSSKKQNNFRDKRFTEHKLRVLIFPAAFCVNISHSKKNSERYCFNVPMSQNKVPVIGVRV